ncbi:hypothetical protein MMC18_009693, partial [Xylographa bjoerkii]|nr:hypothetical protein [Xylographa bjoerkii]
GNKILDYDSIFVDKNISSRPELDDFIRKVNNITIKDIEDDIGIEDKQENEEEDKQEDEHEKEHEHKLEDEQEQEYKLKDSCVKGNTLILGFTAADANEASIETTTTNA